MVFTLHLNKQPKKYYFGFVALKQAPRLPFTPPAPYYHFGFVALALRFLNGSYSVYQYLIVWVFIVYINMTDL